MSLLEAMASTVPVVATRTCNFHDITAYAAGWECDPNPQSLFEGLRLALQADELERKQRAKNGRLLVQRKYNWPVIIPLILQACSTYC